MPVTPAPASSPGDFVKLDSASRLPAVDASQLTNVSTSQATTTFALTGVITPATISANQDDYTPAGLASATVLRVSSSSAFNITGVTGGVAGRILILHNAGANNIVLVHAGAGSTAANRFTFPGAADVTLTPDKVITIQYDATTQRWRAASPFDSYAAPGATSVGTTASAGTANTAARSDHVHQSNTAPANVTKAAAAIGTSGEPARADHKHDVSTAAPAATGVSTASAEGTATSLARSDHTHQSNTAPANVTKAAAAIGTSGEPARADHKHDVTTAAPAATGVSTASAEGSATTLARSDHSHQSNTAPVNVTKAAAAIGTSGEPARADHKHDVTTASASANPPGTASAEGTSTSLARADHTHALAAFGTTAATFCEGSDARLSNDRTASGLRTATTVVSVSAAAAPTAGQTLVATSGTAATWQTPSGGAPSGPAGGDLSGTYPNPTVSGSSVAFVLSGTLTPAAIGANQNDYSPAGLATSNFVRLSASTPGFTITGLATGAEGRIVTVHNVGSFPITLADESASSTAANRFSLNGSCVISAGSALLLQYDNTSQRWRILSPRQITTTQVAQTGTITTTSTTDTLATSMTITPEAGTYIVLFACTAGNSNTTTSVFISIYAGGTIVSGSLRQTLDNVANWRAAMNSVVVVTVNGAQAIEGRWRVSANTGSMLDRTLIVLRVGA